MNALKWRGWAREIATIGSEDGELKIEQNRKLQAKCQNELSARGEPCPLYLGNLILSISLAFWKLIKHPLPILEAERTKRLEKERDEMLKHRLNLLQELQKSCVLQLPANSLVPSIADLFMSPGVRELIEDSPDEGEFTLVHLNSIKESFRETSKRWASEIKAKLFSMMHGRTLSDGEEELRDIDTVLNLATTFFICSSCSSHGPFYCDHEPSFRYRRAIMHTCAAGKD